MNTQQLLNYLKKNPLVLAPMAGITDSPFRSFMKEMGCGILTTELVSAKSLQMKNIKSNKLMDFTKSQHPIGIQIFGEDLNAFTYAAQIIEQLGADFVDLNFGCPVNKIIKKGAGSAVLKDIPFLCKILKTVKNAVSIPVSIKVRTGWDMNSRNTKEISQIAYNEGIIWLSLHGRTRKQAYNGQADWDYITEVKKQSPLPIIGNGDLINATQILELKKQSLCDGMMIGRGCLKNPWIFIEAQKKMQIQTETQSQTKPVKCYINILKKLQYHLQNFYDEKMFLLQYKKFSTWYSSGYPESNYFRQAVFKSRTTKEVLDIVQNYFQKIDLETKQAEKYDPSLMQGHG